MYVKFLSFIQQKESQKPKVWEKNKKKKGKGPAKKKKPANKFNKKAASSPTTNNRVEEEEKSTPEANGVSWIKQQMLVLMFIVFYSLCCNF